MDDDFLLSASVVGSGNIAGENGGSNTEQDDAETKNEDNVENNYNHLYPLHQISEPHETNDVLFRSSASPAQDDDDDAMNRRSRLQLLYETHPGNRRFDRLIQEYAIDFHQQPNRSEKPMVALRLLEHWRHHQDPPGRFLLYDGISHMWNDVGNRKAREKISRALRRCKPRPENEQLADPNSKVAEAAKVELQKDGEIDMTATKLISAHWKALPLLEEREGFVLYGRDKEQERLKRLYHQHRQDESSPSTHNFCLLSGATGVGKKALAQILQSVVEEDGGFYLKGKFESLQTCSVAGPFAAFVEALTHLAAQLEEKDDDEKDDTIARPAVHSCRKAIREELENHDSALFYGLLPALEKLMGQKKSTYGDQESKSVVVNKGALGDKRVQFVLHMLFKAIVSQRIPLVVVLEDMHWATDTALDFWSAVMTDIVHHTYIFLCGTFRNNGSAVEVEKLEQTIEHLQRHGDEVTHIPLENLEKNVMDQILTDSLSLTTDKAAALCDRVYAVTKGNFLFVKDFLRHLQENELLRFDKTFNTWTCDKHLVDITMNVENIEDIVRARLLELPPDVQDTLMIAACFGSTIDDELLSMVKRSLVLPHLQMSASKGLLVVSKENDFFRFSHDGVQQEAYKLIPEDGRKAFHLRVGLRIWRKLDEAELDDHIYVVLGQLMKGDSLLKEDNDRIAVASLCLRAGRKIAQAAGFQAALMYLRHGISLLGQRQWRDSYPICLSLHNAAAEACYCTAQFDEVESLVSTILENARNFKDTLLARSTLIYALGGTVRFREAFDIARATLKELDEPIPHNPTFLRLKFAVQRTKRLLRCRSDASILRLPMMEREDKIAAMQILNAGMVAAHLVNLRLGPFFQLRMVELTIKYGLCTLSSLGFIGFGVFLACGGINIEEGFKYGQIGWQIYEKFKNESFLGGVTTGYHGCLVCWKRPCSACFEPLKRAYHVGLRTGDIGAAGFSAMIYCWNAFESMPLPLLEREVRVLVERMRFFGQQVCITLVEPLWQMILNFMGKADGNPCELTGTAMIRKDALALAKELNPSAIDWIDFCTLILECTFGNDPAASTSTRFYRILDQPHTAMDAGNVLFFGCMSLIRQAQKGKRGCLLIARHRMRRLGRWALHAPSNFNGKLLLLEAELAAFCGKDMLALSKYRSAIIDLRDAGFLMEEAMANEQLAKYHLKRDDEISAAPFLREAIRLYKNWGATAKVSHLENEVQVEFKVAPLG